jgi:phage baseplate assembly protein W
MATGIPSAFRRGPRDIATLSGQELVKDQIEQILGTRAGDRTSVGELAWRPDFGSRIHILLHYPIKEDLASLAFPLIIEALNKWLPSIQVLDVRISVLESDGNSGIGIEVDYRDNKNNIVGTASATVH